MTDICRLPRGSAIVNDGISSARYRLLVILTVVLATGSMVVEATIINVAIPAIMRQFSISTEDAQWLSTGFLGAMVTTMLLAAWFERRFGPRLTYAGALVMFSLASLAGGMADSMPLLIAARIAQGAISGLIQPLGLVVIFRVFAPSERGRAMSAFGLGVVLAPAIGPALGGYLVDLVSWRAIFFVTLPLCVAGIFLSLRYLPARDSSSPQQSFDLPGLVLMALFIFCLLTGFAVGHSYGWTARAFLLRLGIGLAVTAALVIWEMRTPHPLLQLRLFYNRSFAASAMVAFAYGLGLYGSTYLLPLYVMVVTSLKGMPEIRLGNIFSPPLEVTFEPWAKAWATACTGLNCDGLSRGFWNSVRITVPSTLISILVASVNGYALANWKFKGADLFFTILIVGAFIPYQVMIYPIVIVLRELGIYGTLTGLIIVHTIFGMPILTLLFRNYFSSLPEELFKAARIDGAGFWQIYFRIMLPMSLPIFVVAMILQITGIWNDFLFGVVFTRPEYYPMTVQLNNIVNSVQGVKEYNVNMAATLLTGAVPLFVYFVSGRLFVRGIAAGAVKG